VRRDELGFRWAGNRNPGRPAGAHPCSDAEAEGARALFKLVADRVDERLFGVREPLRLVMVGILTGNHVLIDDVPGVGKTTLVRMLSTLLGLRFQRVQFTPDLMPSDITGTSVLNLKTNDFQFRPGPALHAGAPGRRDQPGDAEDAGGPAGGDAGATGDRRR
jgi:hypothetical protein